MKRVLLLSGGAFKGAVQLRSIRRVLAEVGMPDEIRGTSVGAVNGAMVASGRIDELESIWRDLDDPHPLDGVRGFLRATPLSKGGFWSLDPLGDMIDARRVTWDRLLCRFGVGVWLPETDRHVVVRWSKDGPIGAQHRWTLRDGVTASAAIAGLFAGIPVIYAGRHHFAADGGHEHVLPPPPAELGAGDLVDAIACHPVTPGVIVREGSEVDGRIERLVWAADKATHAPLRGDVANLRTLARVGVHVRVWAPSRDPRGMLDASRETIAYRLDDLGAEIADAPVYDSARL